MHTPPAPLRSTRPVSMPLFRFDRAKQHFAPEPDLTIVSQNSDRDDDYDFDNESRNADLIAYDLAVRYNPQLLNTRTPISIRREDVPCHRDRQFGMVSQNDGLIRNKLGWTQGAMEMMNDDHVSEDSRPFDDDPLWRCFQERYILDKQRKDELEAQIEERSERSFREIKQLAEEAAKQERERVNKAAKEAAKKEREQEEAKRRECEDILNRCRSSSALIISSQALEERGIDLYATNVRDDDVYNFDSDT